MNTFTLPHQTSFYQGKVRDVYYIQDKLVVMLVSNRLSAFDVILPKPIPYKGQVLNQIAAYMLKATANICPNWLLAVPAPNVSIGKKCNPFKIEVVVRGNLTGHAWRTYASGKRMLCGNILPEGLKENDFFSHPIITPSTKAAEGHDEDISKDEIIAQGLASKKDWEKMEQYAFQLFDAGKNIAQQRGLMLVDTKYEFGKIDDKIFLMDEIHTPDSSRYFYADGFKEKQKNGEKQKQLSKEFVRDWLIENNFMGRPGETIPEMTDEWVNTISKRYIELYETLTGAAFQPEQPSDEEIYEKICETIETLRL
jgi:phosphoribosylaminoimidazole-succinocarboxamide synthase